MTSINARATEVARASYGRLLAIIAAQAGDIAAAEDALADAFAKALENWPKSGIPDNPEGWLLTVSRNRLRDRFRSAANRGHISLDSDESLEVTMADIDTAAIPDERLKLMFVCAHPAIDTKIRTPLMLQSVLGLEAETIGSAFLIPATAMAQRLVRAKRKIKDAAIPFAIPERTDMATRLEPVLEAIYGTYAIEWEGVSNNNELEDLSIEALFLADLLASLLPDEPEALGLAALLSFSIARRNARYDEENHFVPLHQQDTGKWDRIRIARAEALLSRAQKLGQLGRFQLEAAIQSVHTDRAKTGHTDWQAIAQLYEGLMAIAPTIGGAVGRAAAVGEAFGPEAGLNCLEQIDAKTRNTFQPALAVTAHLLALQGAHATASETYTRAISLTTLTPIRQYLLAQQAMIPQGKP